MISLEVLGTSNPKAACSNHAGRTQGQEIKGGIDMKGKLFAALVTGLTLFVTTSCANLAVTKFVRNTYIDQDRNLVVEKCTLHWSQWDGTITTGDCSIEKHRLDQ